MKEALAMTLDTHRPPRGRPRKWDIGAAILLSAAVLLLAAAVAMTIIAIRISN